MGSEQTWSGGRVHSAEGASPGRDPDRPREPRARHSPHAGPAPRAKPREPPGPGPRRAPRWWALPALAVLGVAAAVGARRPATGPHAPAPPLVLGPQPRALPAGAADGPLAFSVHGPARVLALLHLDAEAAGPGALTVVLDGAKVGEVPAGAAPGRRERTLVLPPGRLVRGSSQRLALVPRGRWRVHAAWLEPLALPALPPAELLAEAHAALARGVRLGHAERVAPANLHDAWRALRTAWLLLEAHPAPPAALLADVRAREAAARAALDARCGALLLGVEAALRRGDAAGAHAALARVEDHVPAGLHPCAARARALLAP